MGVLDNTRGLVIGIANERSLAYGIAKACRQEGAELALTYQNDRLARRVLPIGEELGAAWVQQCDLTDEREVSELHGAVAERWGKLDFLVHSAAYAERGDLEGRFIDTSRAGFLTAMEVSVYSLLSVVRTFEPLLTASAAPAVLTLTYYGSEKVIPNYNVMGVAKAALEAAVRYLAADLGPKGIRVNAISAGPVKTLSAAAIRGLREMLGYIEKQAPLRRTTDIGDVGGAAVFALSRLARGMTGEIFHVDSGYHLVGAPTMESLE